MEIIEKDSEFIVVENDVEIWISKTLDEAQGFIVWKNRPDAGNTPQECGCIN